VIAREDLPVAVIGGGPVGLAAAAHLIERNVPVQVFEAGETVAANMRDWAHVRVFSPWHLNIDSAARKILTRHGWQEPEADGLPTGGDIVARYLKPLADTPELRGVIETGARVVAISRQGLDKVTSRGRAERPFALTIEGKDGRRRIVLASAVIDASGTWQNPNPMGAAGLPVAGEHAYADRIAYGIPDILGAARAAYAGRRTLVLGGGHSAANVLIDLATLAETDRDVAIVWALRGTDLSRVFGGGADDQLEARGKLGSDLRALVDRGTLQLVTGFSVEEIAEEGGALIVTGRTADGPLTLGPVDRIVACTGQRPDLAMTRELRLDLDPWLECARVLGPEIDPNLHSCGSVPPHGYKQLSHPEPDYFAVGIKSYGRAPTFLMATGYEQVRSIAAFLAGDIAAADDVQLVLPETGVCTVSFGGEAVTGGGSCCGSPAPKKAEEIKIEAVAEASSCCGGPAPGEVDACCVKDAEAKAQGETGCGCGSSAKQQAA
jgi:thioredoxin reductase